MFSQAVPNLELLCDVDTQWDSIEDFFTLCKYHDNASKNLTDPEWKTLEEVVEILLYPHDVQQLMSGKVTPTLTGVLPAFQGLQNCWEGLLATVTPTKKHYIIEGMEWLNKYHKKAGRTLAYTMAMGVYLAMLTHSFNTPMTL
ncbi:hypothetical protein BS47DRAFT_1305944 [Hydnum rufescens UP504]|uniref:Uncharacterized protein n=1 Tax=Hydnum rufescens UP504 TaxID=1448309 RepID=A0A9P6AHR6_9AGAM|nr:hypothetical protein BS47DRAFT_1305944 [Hydnum rufescens UP504]